MTGSELNRRRQRGDKENLLETRRALRKRLLARALQRAAEYFRVVFVAIMFCLVPERDGAV